MSCIPTMVCFQSKSFSCLLVGSRNDSCLGMTSTMEDFNPCLLILTTKQSRIVDLLNFYKLVKLFENYFKKGFIFKSGERRRPLCRDPTPGVFNSYIMILMTPAVETS